MYQMNAVQVLKNLEDTIRIEERFLENVLLHRSSSPTGHVYVHDNRGHFNEEQIKERVNSELIRHCQQNLGFCIVDQFAETLFRCVRDNEQLSEKALVLKTHHYNVKISASDVVKNTVDLLNIDEHYFERLVAYALVYDRLNKDQWYTDHNLNAEAVKEAVSKVKFNNFSLNYFSSAEDKECFLVNTENLYGFVMLLNRVAGNNFSEAGSTKVKDYLARIDAFCDADLVKEYAGIKMTALKGGKIKFTLDKEMAKAIEEKVTPYLESFKLTFIEV